MDAIKAAYGATVQIKDLPKDGLNLTLKINLSKLPANQGVSGVKGRLVKMEIRASTCVEEKEEVGA
ncbi:hypothetical protein HN51_026827 [Arachis hypogaea]|uniref:Uncharacterized protein n=1 Tax=Arachis hypogaea TaxID=3818 RepID=A0A445BQD3_ARAHY|nr:hypothetical protein Ahy_A09g046610 [Arachis hypogaea]